MEAIAAALAARGFRHAWVLDFEFRQPWGARPTPHCMVAQCVITGEELRFWLPARCPFSCGRDELFIAYSASAEMECFLALGWVPPPNILDLFIEFLALRNGWPRDREHDGLIDAMAHFGEPCMDVDEKFTLRKLAMRGGPYTEAEQKALIVYCAQDVDATLRLLPHLWRARKLDRPVDFAQALGHSRYQGAVAAMRATGVPMSTATYKRLDAHWGRLKTALIEEVNPRYRVYIDGSFNERAFEKYLARQGLLPLWPRTNEGGLSIDKDTFSEMAKLFPKLDELKQLRQITGKLRAIDLEIGEDGRNRFYVAPYRTKTGRNAPSNSRFVFGAFKGLRNLITPPRDRALGYCDWITQEIGVGAARSGDALMWEHFASGDFHMRFTISIGQAPPDATKATHGAVRDAMKAVSLGVLYGMSAYGLSIRLGISETSADDLLKRHQRLYPRFWAWCEDNINRAMMGFPLKTRDGWPLQYAWGSHADPSPRTPGNFPVQGNAATLLRAAAIASVESGLSLCCSVHDAFLIEAKLHEIDDAVATLRRIMGDASEAVLGAGYRIEADKSIYRWPNAYRESKGFDLFNMLLAKLSRMEAA